MDRIEQIRFAKLKNMAEWRMRPEANGMQQAEMEALVWAIELIESFYSEVEV